MFLGRRYAAEEAARIGLVHQAFADGALEKEVDAILQVLCANAPLAIANSKTIIEEFVKAEGQPDHAAMHAAMERCAKSADYEEGRKAFMEKRKPRFQGK
jgi:enoyl-CoA hydratase/carnithine racemase